ncbi:hypothetical protein [Halobacillus sp. H74]|uniref:hypothetical protein n=1 Tax=Halobacillus sp. H74 TaxID=3457436 RepID=UPI003FCEB3F6
MEKLVLDDEELSILARYSVRVDQTIVVEPLKRLTEDTVNRILENNSTVKKVGIQASDLSSPLTFEGPYMFKRVNGILIFNRTAS